MKKCDKPANQEQKNNVTIAVWSPHSAGATTVAASLFTFFTKYTDKAVTALDADIFKPELDAYLGVELTPSSVKGSGGSLNFMCDALKQGNLSVDVYNELVIKNKNGFIITGNTSLSDMENIWNGDKNSDFFKGVDIDCFDYYDSILKAARETSNIVISDCGSGLWMDSTKYFLHHADYIIVVVSAVFSKLQWAKVILEHCEAHMGIRKDKTIVLVNQYTAKSLEMSKVKHLLKGWDMTGVIKYNTVYIDAANNGKFENINKIDEEAWRGISDVIGITKEETFFEKIKHFGKKNKNLQGDGKVD